MGYQSDTSIVIALPDLETVKRVMAVYRMDKAVQKYELEKRWDVLEFASGFFLHHHSYGKWYENYEDISALNYMHLLVKECFLAKTVACFAYSLIRIGEDRDDIETAEDWDGDDGDDLLEYADEFHCLDRRILVGENLDIREVGISDV